MQLFCSTEPDWHCNVCGAMWGSDLVWGSDAVWGPDVMWGGGGCSVGSVSSACLPLGHWVSALWKGSPWRLWGKVTQYKLCATTFQDGQEMNCPMIYATFTLWFLKCRTCYSNLGTLFVLDALSFCLRMVEPLTSLPVLRLDFLWPAFVACRNWILRSWFCCSTLFLVWAWLRHLGCVQSLCVSFT